MKLKAFWQVSVQHSVSCTQADLVLSEACGIADPDMPDDDGAAACCWRMH